MHTVQIDTGDLILGLTGLTRKTGDASPREETAAAVELCNNLILYRTIFYDGRVVESNLAEIRRLKDLAHKAIDDADTRELWRNKVQPIELDEPTEAGTIRDSARQTIKPLLLLDQLTVAQSTNPLYVNDPFQNLPDILKFFEHAEAPEESAIRHLYDNRKIRGGRFFWGLLQEKCFGPVKEYLRKHKGNESFRLRVLFARFRYCFAANRGHHLHEIEPELTGSVDYQAEASRQKMIGQFADSLQPEQAWNKEIQEELMRRQYPDGNAAARKDGEWLFVNNRTNIPLLVNRALLPLTNKQFKRAALLRECLELSQQTLIEQIWDALDTYNAADESKQREIRELMCDFAKTQSDPLVRGSRVLEAIKKIQPLEVLKEFFAKTLADSLSAERHSASILGRSINGLSAKLDVLGSVQEVFGSIPPES